ELLERLTRVARVMDDSIGVDVIEGLGLKRSVENIALHEGDVASLEAIRRPKDAIAEFKPDGIGAESVEDLDHDAVTAARVENGLPLEPISIKGRIGELGKIAFLVLLGGLAEHHLVGAPYFPLMLELTQRILIAWLVDHQKDAGSAGELAATVEALE